MYKYQHIERFGTDEVDGIQYGTCYVFPKVDGSNGSVWWDGGLKAANRNRDLSLEEDNLGFYAFCLQNKELISLCQTYPHLVFFGEWLVPHSLTAYREDAWNKFYIFDVQEKDSDTYIHYEAYSKLLDVYDVNYITPICTIVDGTYEQFCNQLEKNVFLMKDGLGAGEGVCCKNYEYKNKYGRQTWAKIVRNEFKEIHKKVMGLQEIKGKLTVEKKIVDKYCTSSFIDKTFAKINVDGWSSKKINELFGRVFYDLIIEESWNFIKEFKLPIIDYKELNRLVINKVKECKKELFTNFSGGLKCKK